MTLTTNQPQQKLTLAQFVQQLPDEEGRYELVDGEVMRFINPRLIKGKNQSDLKLFLN